MIDSYKLPQVLYETESRVLGERAGEGVRFINTISRRLITAFRGAEEILAGFAKVGVDDAALAAQLQREGAQFFGKSWNELMDTIASKGQVPGKTTQTRAKR